MEQPTATADLRGDAEAALADPRAEHAEAPTPGWSGIRVVVVAHGPPLKGGIATVALDLVEDVVLNTEFDIVFVNTSQNDDQRGKLALENITRAVVDAVSTFRAARRGGVVHSHAVQQPWLVGWRQVAIAAAARLRGSRVLLHNHAQPPYMEPPGEYRVSRLNRWAFAVLDRLAAANILIAEAGVPNIAPLMPHTPLPVVHNSAVVGDVPRSGLDHDPPRVLFIGELLERKGVLTLLDALELLDERGVGYDLRIVGDNRPGLDPDKDLMVAAITDRGRAASMTGPLTRSEVYAELAAADVYVFPTWTEGQPFTVIEALSAGVPIVASDIQAISNMISDPANGRLLDQFDVVGFADAIEEVLGDRDLRRRIGEANRELALTRFDRSVFRRRIAEIYRMAAADPAGLALLSKPSRARGTSP